MKFLSQRLTGAAIMTLCTTAFLFSCKKDNTVPPRETTAEEAAVYSSESLQADASYDDIQDIAITAGGEEELETGAIARGGIHLFKFARLRSRIGDCADIIVAPADSSYPKTVTIDFGNGCEGRDGKWRKGKIVLHFTGRIHRSGSVLSISLVDFQLNHASIKGSKIIINQSSGDDIRFSVQVVDGSVSFPNGRGYTYERKKHIRQVEGENTEELSDDVYSIQGRSSTTFETGIKIVLDTQEPLIKRLNCAWISAGTLKIEINKWPLLLDYGFPNNGNCDNTALLNWNNQQQVIVLP